MGDRLVADATATLPGRGAWLHPTVDCLEKSIVRRAFRRALPRAEANDPDDLRRYLMKSPSTTGGAIVERTG